jgi:hypothetical protein
MKCSGRRNAPTAEQPLRRSPSAVLTQWLLRAPLPTEQGCFEIPIRPTSGAAPRPPSAPSARSAACPPRTLAGASALRR